MSRISFAKGEFYHVYNRGTEKRDIFIDDRDYQRFLCLLFAANNDKPVDLKLQGRTLYEMKQKEVQFAKQKKLVDLVGYTLMSNHFHLLLKERAEGGISTFMRKLGTAYTMYFNAKNDRSGALFQGKFKAKHIDDDQYLKYLLAYIHLNPLSLVEASWKESSVTQTAKAQSFLSKYQYSSYIDYVGGFDRLESVLLSREDFGLDLKTENLYEATMEDFLQGRTLYE